MAPTEPRRRRAITTEQRIALRSYAQQHCSLDQQQLASWFEQQFGHRPSQGTISESLSARFSELDQRSEGPSQKRLRTQHWLELEACLYEWQLQIETQVAHRRFPHGKLPPVWSQFRLPSMPAGRALPRQGSLTDALLARDISCRLTDTVEGTEHAHLVPRTEGDCFRQNTMFQYGVAPRPEIRSLPADDVPWLTDTSTLASDADAPSPADNDAIDKFTAYRAIRFPASPSGHLEGFFMYRRPESGYPGR
jgi:hypothetical protein